MLPAATHAQEARLKVFKVFSPVMQVGHLAKLVAFYKLIFRFCFSFLAGEASFLFCLLMYVSSSVVLQHS